MTRPDAQYLRSILDYDPKSGRLTWKKRPADHFLDARTTKIWNTVNEGKTAGHLASQGYVRVWIDGKRYMAHCLAWVIKTGEWPRREIDHRDLDKSNNRWTNLRESTTSQNHFNIGLTASNKTGFKGVCYESSRNQYRAAVMIAGKTIFLGRFATPEEAHQAYCEAAQKHHGEYARTA